MTAAAEQIIANLSRHISLTEDETSFFLSRLKAKTLDSGDVLLQAGQACDTFNYVVHGALRAFFSTENDKEVTIMFAIADWWITDMPCFVNRQPAMISITAIEDTSILQLRYEDLELLYTRIPKFERAMRIMMQNAYVREQLRVLQTFSQPAEERYLNFLQKYPGIASKVTNKHIASYLGITPEFLSVVRSRLRHK
ncbi:Crp/Fnr family transcriptional regulator [Pseudochryseolinea flava]|uniref:Crp/Fnr family transcriptional regulator n=1 Tax=Pseudochryseolinea flava TaxID=2059302 RepID=A0A364Y183_9BACT|nr:Crp/Fnr family transcriptional regulator [Pseudochryseolinea flava]RAW00583.1 Crp/Fnr family transcriptional regulator [Pseudochryseolinea flava]